MMMETIFLIMRISKTKSMFIGFDHDMCLFRYDHMKIFIMDSFITIIITATVLSADKVQLQLCPMLPSKSCSR